MRALTTSEIVILVVALIAAVAIIGWRAGGRRATRIDREAEREREIED